MRANLEECVADLRAACNDDTVLCAVLAEMVGLTAESVRRVVVGGGKPMGMSLPKYFVALGDLGYQVEEFLQLVREVQLLCYLVARREVTADQAHHLAGRLGFQGEDPRDGMYRLFRGQPVCPSEDRTAAICDEISRLGLSPAVLPLPALGPVQYVTMRLLNEGQVGLLRMHPRVQQEGSGAACNGEMGAAAPLSLLMHRLLTPRAVHG